MHHIRDKKRWWVANFCSPTVAPQYLPMIGLGFAIGMVGILFIGMALLALAPHMSGASLAIVVPVVAGQRNSITMKHLRGDIAARADKALEKAANDKREMTADEKKAYDADIADIKNLNTMIADAEVSEAALVDTKDMSTETRRPATEIHQEKKKLSGVEIVNRYGRPKLFKPGVGGWGSDTIHGAAENAYAAGQWILAAIYGRPAAAQWCKDHGIPLVKDATSEGTNPSGGFLVPTILENMIIDLREQYGVFRQEAKIFPMASDAVNVPRRVSGLTAYPIGESTAPTETTKQWNQVNLVARKWGVLTRYTTEVAEDAIINVAEDLAEEIAYAFSFKEDDAGFNGDGSGAYHGITGIVTKFNNNTSYVGAVAAASGHNTFSTLDNVDLTKAMASIPRYAVRNAKWYVSQAGFSACFQRLASAAGGNTVITMPEGVIFQYMGYPIVIAQALPTALTTLASKAMILFGDLASAVAMGTRRGITLMTSEHAYFTTDEIGIRGMERFDIVVHDVGDATAAGPLVAMMGTT